MATLLRLLRVVRRAVAAPSNRGGVDQRGRAAEVAAVLFSDFAGTPLPGVNGEIVEPTERSPLLRHATETSLEPERRQPFRTARDTAVGEAVGLRLCERVGDCLATLLLGTWVLSLLFSLVVLFWVEIENVSVFVQSWFSKCDPHLKLWLFVRICMVDLELFQDESFPTLRLFWNVVGWQWSMSAQRGGGFSMMADWIDFVLPFDLLWYAAGVLASFSVTVSLFVLRYLLERGYIKNPRAAGPDALACLRRVDMNMAAEEAEASASSCCSRFRPLRPGNGECCCCCMERFGVEKPIVATPCNHFMHECCLQDWLKLARTCPLCRYDLDSAEKVPPLVPAADTKAVGAAVTTSEGGGDTTGVDRSPTDTDAPAGAPPYLEEP